MTRTIALRLAVLGMLSAAVLDPGCERRRQVPVVLVAGRDVAPETIAQVTRMVEAARHRPVLAGAGPEAIRLGIGSPRDLMRAHELHPLGLAVRTPDASMHIVDMVVPGAMVAGVSSVVRVRVGGSPAVGAGSAVQVRDATTGQRMGVKPVPEDGTAGAWVEVPLLPATPGHVALCVSLTAGSDGEATDECERASVTVWPAAVRVDVLEARPSWTGRFARLAMERWQGAAIASHVRVAPGIGVVTRSAPAGRSDASVDVTIVSGLDALEPRDVSRLAAAARDDGRVIVLVADGPVDATRLRPLWPHPMRAIVTAPTPTRVGLGVHTWRTREWLAAPASSTDAQALAYLDASPAVPVVLARPLGAGRVVLVTALDAWRWRLLDDVSFDEGWQALVLSLVADARLAAAPVAWRVPGPLADEAHVALPDVAGGRPEPMPGARVLRLGDGTSGDTAFAADGVDGTGAHRAAATVVRTAPMVRGTVASAPFDQTTPATVAWGPAATVPVTWDDVRRTLAADDVPLVDVAALPASLDGLPASRVADGRRWFVTRQWWFAALIVAGLGLEWWWRRLARLM